MISYNYSESQFKALSYYDASDVLRLILKSETVKHASRTGCEYISETAWPVRECFPLPFLVEKESTALTLQDAPPLTVKVRYARCRSRLKCTARSGLALRWKPRSMT